MPWNARPASWWDSRGCIWSRPRASGCRSEIPLRRLAWFDEARDAFVLEGGRHRLVVARHAEDQGIGVDLELEARVVGR